MTPELAAFEAWVEKHPDFSDFESYEIANMLDAWQARAAMQPTTNEGWQLVPKEPTREMKTAGIGVEVYQESPPDMEALTWEEVTAIYQAMLAAAPDPEDTP